MRARRFRFWLTILLSIFFLTPVLAEQTVKYIPEFETAFKQGLKMYQNQDYQKSGQVFEKLAQYEPTHQRITVSHLMFGKALIRQGKIREGIIQLRNFLNQYPESRYVENAHYEIATGFFTTGNSLAAVREFLWVFNYGATSVLTKKSSEIAEILIDNDFSVQDVQNLVNEIPGEKGLGLLILKLAEKQVRAGNSNTAINTIIDFLNEYPRSEYVNQLETYLDKIRLKAQGNLKIGVLLPINSGYSEDGKSILRGIRFALKEYEEQNQQTIELIVRDSGSNVVKAIKAAKEMATDENIIAVIGELSSDITAAVAAITASSEVPLIAPVASQNGLASISNNIFQANSDLFERGRKMATYAVKELGMRTFAALAPADDYGREMTEGFTTTVENLGGSVVAPPKWYFEGSKDFIRQLKSIRAVGFELMKEDSVWARKHAVFLARATIDSFAVPVTSIDGLFCPIYAGEIQYIGPQTAALNLRARILGGDYWFDLDVLRTNQNYVNQVVFVSDYFVDEYSPEYRRFRTNYRIKMGSDFSRMEAFGYDAMTAILRTIQQNKISTRQNLRKFLEQVTDFKGIKGDISWQGNHRVNSEVNILEYNTGLIRKLD
jgi:ABC-type branched-subunit amino acid transport system substrate-binding protein